MFYLHSFAYMFMSFIAYIYYFMLCMSEGGASLKLYFNPCIYNFMSFVIIKKEEIVRPKAYHSSFDDDQLM